VGYAATIGLLSGQILPRQRRFAKSSSTVRKDFGHQNCHTPTPDSETLVHPVSGFNARKVRALTTLRISDRAA